ncbi:MAG: CIA30 family protein [Gemmatimonadales bacterium]|nr:MAG: CIA30 family protein [Gemmatimonadales bacterium]
MLTDDRSARRPPAWLRSHARLLLLPLLFLLPGVAGGAKAPGEAPMPVMVFAFDQGEEARWNVVNDGVMGGRSAGFVTVEDGTLRFAGTLVTRGGGFSSVRARRVIDLSGHAGLELRVRGNGRQFEVEVDDGLRLSRGSLSRRAPFMASEEWTLVRVPFDRLRSTVFGQAVNAPQIDLARIQGVGLYIADGRDGPFRLEVDFIRAYGAAEE